MEHLIKLPSAIQIGEECSVSFFGNKLQGVVQGTVTKVSFTQSKVLYDVEIKFQLADKDEIRTTRLHSIDAAFVQKI